MELISKISKGSRMDQVYLPKHRSGFHIGSYVVIKTLSLHKTAEKPYFYHIDHLEPLKVHIVNDIFGVIDQYVPAYDNAIITGSFLEQGFAFNDIDILVISENQINATYIANSIQDKTGIKTHLIVLDHKTLLEGLSTDPLYQMMISKCIAKKRFIFKAKPKLDYKRLDLHLLKSRILLENFDILNGNEKYYLTRNMVAISLFLRQKKITGEDIDKKIVRIFSLDSIQEIKQNTLPKDSFLKKYKLLYKKTFNEIMGHIGHGTKPE